MCFGKVPQKDIVKAFDVSLIFTLNIVLMFQLLQQELITSSFLIFMEQ